MTDDLAKHKIPGNGIPEIRIISIIPMAEEILLMMKNYYTLLYLCYFHFVVFVFVFVSSDLVLRKEKKTKKTRRTTLKKQVFINF